MNFRLLIATSLAIALSNQEYSRYISSVSGDQMSQASEFWNDFPKLRYKNVESSTTESNIDKYVLDEIISELEELPETKSEYNVNHIHEEQRISSNKRLNSNIDDIVRLIDNLALMKTDYNIKSSNIISENDDIINGEQNQQNKLIRYPSKSDVYWRLNLDDEANYQIYWNYNYPENYITIELQLSLNSFQLGVDLFALGLSENEQPTNADWCVLLFDNTTTSMQLRPGYTNSLGNMLWDASKKAPNPNEHVEKCELIASAIDDNKLIILYQRPLDQCEESGYKIDNGTTHVVWLRLRGPVNNIDNLRIQTMGTGHGSLGNSNTIEQNFKRVQLLSPISTSIASSKKETKGSQANKLTRIKADNPLQYYRRHLNITNDKLAVPSSETTYWCKMFKLPNDILRSKHHITRYEAIIEEGNEHLVHHMELFHCENNEHDLSLEPLATNWSGSCSSDSRPKQTESCKRVILAWAMGAKPLLYPKEVGQPIGGKDYNSYLMLEVHYNNVKRRSDIIDSSGLRLYYTNQLREFDAGVIEVGLEYSEKNSIPPNVQAPLIGYCVSECTRVGLTNDNDDNDGGGGINIFAAQLHTHLTGVSSWTQIMRGNKIIGELNRDNHYSPHFQEIRLLPRQVRVLPGDALIHYCLYNTRDRVNITLGGYAITDEMCVTYLHYYPKVQLEVCKSSIDTNALRDYFHLLAKHENQNVNWQNKSVSQNYLSVEWTPLRAAKLLSLYKESPLSVQCNKSNGDRFPGNWNGIQPPSLLVTTNQNLLQSAVVALNQSEFIESTINEKAPKSAKHPKCSNDDIDYTTDLM